MSYVIDKTRGHVAHEGSRVSCDQYVRTCVSLWGRRWSEFAVAETAAERDKIVKAAKW